jgi:hypothetical protein
MHTIPDYADICQPEINTAYIKEMGWFKWNGILPHFTRYRQHLWAYGEVTTTHIT